MGNPEFPSESLHERTMMAVRQLLERVRGQLGGLERVAVNQGAQMLYPRLEQRVRGASEEQLRSELEQFRSLLDAVLKEPMPDTPKQKKRGNQKSPKAPQQHRRQRRK